MSAHRFGLGRYCVNCGLGYDDFREGCDQFCPPLGAPEARAEGQSPAERSGDHNPTPDATTAAGNKSSANLKEAP